MSSSFATDLALKFGNPEKVLYKDVPFGGPKLWKTIPYLW